MGSTERKAIKVLLENLDYASVTDWEPVEGLPLYDKFPELGPVIVHPGVTLFPAPSKAWTVSLAGLGVALAHGETKEAAVGEARRLSRGVSVEQLEKAVRNAKKRIAARFL